MAARQANTFLNRSPIFTSTGILAGSYSRRDLRLGAKFALLLGGRGNEILELLKAQYVLIAPLTCSELAYALTIICGYRSVFSFFGRQRICSTVCMTS